MGIPAYFSQIIRDYPQIFIEYIKNEIQINNLYLDCNGIIYDQIILCSRVKDINIFENELIEKTCKKIDYYINLFNPNKKVIIAFDGVPPIAKLEQQRNRRYKSWYMNNHIFEKDAFWDTSSITPGTEFMKKLCQKVNGWFKSKFNNLEILIYDSYIKGEGEHKIFQYIRNNSKYHKETTSIIYGLDADLIMLSLLHLKISTNIYLYRETPHFAQSINSNISPDKNYVLDIFELAKKINFKMSDNEMLDCINDYIFICFFLGNDFMPHFPSLNIRTNGIEILIEHYKLYCTDKIIKNDTINWCQLKKIIKKLAENEKELFIQEHVKRSKLAVNLKRKPLDKESHLMNKPVYNRDIENFINPNKDFWEERYYKELFKIDKCEQRIKEISTNFLEGLEWNFKYYTKECFHWGWKYNYNYPPLLSDLYRYIPDFETVFIENPMYTTIKPITQLAYVLPRNSMNLLPKNLYINLIEKKSEWYTLDLELQWSYCRYLWESHVILPEIDINELNLLIDST